MRVILVVVCLMLICCKGDVVHTPKPRMYPRVIFPVKEKKTYAIESCDFRFDAPTYFQAIKDKYFYQDEEVQHPCWFDLEAAVFNSSLHCSYYPLQSLEELNQLVNDAFKVTNRHNVKASYIEDLLISRPAADVYGLMFSVEGPVASPVQFYLTDSTEHFFRAALYFNSKVNPDSTAIVLDYLRADINTIIGSWEWVQ